MPAIRHAIVVILLMLTSAVTCKASGTDTTVAAKPYKTDTVQNEWRGCWDSYIPGYAIRQRFRTNFPQLFYQRNYIVDSLHKQPDLCAAGYYVETRGFLRSTQQKSIGTWTCKAQDRDVWYAITYENGKSVRIVASASPPAPHLTQKGKILSHPGRGGSPNSR